MKFVINIAGYLLVLIGCSLEAWLIYAVVLMSYVTANVAATSGYPSRLKIVITNPATDVVSQPMIQIIGYFPEEIETVACNVTNVTLHRAGWQGQGYVTSQFFDHAKEDRIRQEMLKNRFKPWTPGSRMERLESVFTTNFFQIYDVNLAKGKNRVTIHVKDRNGRDYSTKRFFTLDYSQDKTPPVLKMIWPQDKSDVAGDSFTLNAQVDDNNATIKTTIKNAQERVHTGYAIVERNGLVWVKDLPISPGLNEVTIVATDAAGNSSTNRVGITRSSVSVTMQPLANDQLNKPLVSVNGTVSDATCRVEVNGITAMVHSDGTWEGHKVPVSPTGTAQFKVSIFSNSRTNNETH